ncbi:MAG: 16S rRNA (cytidine(1402)-2'-O)-methyltransferase [Symploca sp. SIO3C6]|uniref:Ribosomal RNA small subunit methyltransferase I n=1 Tax=Symploca sp. SIO1C4 TaxID=2607765 RepID=A0A6B3NL03_9CYAN|nr:16S rRNA (cytidine(1402)-2'-O)-methyltransferase [Symploca sp. SIO3C6]NER31112.1 16S rRNA (cytidine(1402)-2'-O)-methyltransferase [Symploca sp. SIO1C4]
MGTLYIVGTPIGNLEDITFRAVRVLQSVDLIAAEDTRHTGNLLQHLEIKTPQLSYHEHNRQQRIPELLSKLSQGKDIALVTDAGMPGISDPGYELVKACIEAEVSVVPVPGANAAITALIAAGLPTDRFVFEGFLPASGQERQKRLESLPAEPRTLIFYESPHRLRQTLQDLADYLEPLRLIVLARELTKWHEQFWRGTIRDAIAHYNQHEPKGEFTIIVAGAQLEIAMPSPEALKAELFEIMSQGVSRSQASRQLAQLTKLPRRQLYQMALALPAPPIPEYERDHQKQKGRNHPDS